MSTTAKVPAANPAIVPVEGATQAATTTTSPYGVNNENLPERLQEALRRLVLQFSTESEASRRQEVRRIKQAHQFWRGLQYLWWDERDQNWHLPFEQKLMDNSSLEDMPRYEFVTNIYQAFGLSLVSVLSQDVPTVRFFPSSAQAEEDVAAAKAATEVAGLVERNNRIGNLIVEEAFNLWTDGKVGASINPGFCTVTLAVACAVAPWVSTTERMTLVMPTEYGPAGVCDKVIASPSGSEDPLSMFALAVPPMLFAIPETS